MKILIKYSLFKKTKLLRYLNLLNKSGKKNKDKFKKANIINNQTTNGRSLLKIMTKKLTILVLHEIKIQFG